jgi:hypothetical protein
VTRTIVILSVTATVALLLTVLLGATHDYPAYVDQWRLVLDGLDPWSTDNAYGPLHNAFALLVPLHPLAPKILTVAAMLIANGLLVLRLERLRPFAEWRTTYFAVFAANALILICGIWYGNNDVFVAALVMGAVLARLDRRFVLAGMLLGLATLDKYYPLLLVPFFALDARSFNTRLTLSALLTVIACLGAGIVLWGSDFLEALRFGVGRDATILSILRPIVGIGRDLGIARYTDLLVLYNGPVLLLVWLLALVLAWRRRDSWLVSASWGFFALLLTYKVGHQQFWVTWLALVACLPLLGTPEADRLARVSLPFATFLSVFQLGFALIHPTYYRGGLHFIPNYIGFISFGLGVWTLWRFLRPGAAAATAASRPRA